VNPIRGAAGGKDPGDEPLLVEFAIVERLGAGAKNVPAPTVRAGVEGKRVGLQQNDETIVFGEDGLSRCARGGRWQARMLGTSRSATSAKMRRPLLIVR
jgi:hypothetical protein